MDSLKLGEHIVYIDITNVCALDCKFCMYTPERNAPSKNLKLNEFASKNIAALINHKKTSKTTISGEGEPFNNYNTIKQILNLSTGGNNFEIITNGIWIDKRFTEIINELNSIAIEKGDQYTIRVSIDSYHMNKTFNSLYSKVLECAYNIKKYSKNISFSVRSIIEDKINIRENILGIFSKLKINAKIIEKSILDDEIIFDNGKTFEISYKNLVNPHLIQRDDFTPLEIYVAAIEQKYGKKFTFGNLATKNSDKGLDITIKPEGSVLFYGIEVKPFANIFKDKISIPYFEKIVFKDRVINYFYTRPFIQLIRKLRKNPTINQLITQTNNPYWVVKTLFMHHEKQLLEEIHD